jgi:hypothetical protein
MKHLQLIGLIACLSFLAGCETIKTTGMGNQETKRLAALQQQRRPAQPDEADQNLWSAQQNAINMDGNPMRRY